MWFHFQAIILLTGLAHYSSAFKYRFIFENDEIFDECTNEPESVLDIHGLFDLSEISFELISDTVAVSGNNTLIWDIQPSDRVEGSVELFRFDRGEWMKTSYRLTVRDVCNKLHDEKQHWYSCWSKHIINLNDVKDKCFNPGTKLVYEPYVVDITFNFDGPPMNGRHKIIMRFRAFNTHMKERDTSICVAILGEMARM